MSGVSADGRRARYYSPGLLHAGLLSAGWDLGDVGGGEPGVVVVPSGAGLVASPPSGPGAAQVAGGAAHGRGGEAGEAAGLGDADLDQAGVVAGWLVIGAGGQLAGVAPGCGLPGADGGRVATGQRWLGGGDGQQRLGAHGQHGMAVEGMPQPDLVLVQAGLALAVGEAFLYRPSLPCDLDQDGQGYHPAFRGVAVVERQVSWV